MKSIRYGIHFTSLAVASIIFWVVRDFRLPLWISNFDFFHYALMGALHATCIVVSLRGRKTSYALGFITLAAALSAFTPFIGLIGSVVWVPFADILRERNLGADSVLITGSAIGASGYWLLVRLFWLRRASWFWAAALCTISTLAVGLILHRFDGYDHGIAKIDPDSISPMLTVGWWFAFSASLYLSEMSQHTFKSNARVRTAN